MVNHSEQLDSVFGALSDPTRREMVRRLSRQALSVSELAEPFSMSLPAVSKHIRVLERAGLLRYEKQGRVRRCELVPEALDESQAWIAQVRDFWQGQLDSLGTFLSEQAKDKSEERG